MLFAVCLRSHGERQIDRLSGKSQAGELNAIAPRPTSELAYSGRLERVQGNDLRRVGTNSNAARVRGVGGDALGFAWAVVIGRPNTWACTPQPRMLGNKQGRSLRLVRSLCATFRRRGSRQSLPV